ncbi:contact-dependent growth inhibition system immunity protein [Pseudomonas cerasi]
MKSCGIQCCEGVITIRPSFHEKAEAWSGRAIEKSDYVVLAANSPEADIGAALRLAFSRCKGSK